MGLSLVEGRLSDRYNHFAEYEFESCQATDTRLMGVVAMKVSWRGRDKARAFVVIRAQKHVGRPAAAPLGE